MQDRGGPSQSRMPLSPSQILCSFSARLKQASGSGRRAVKEPLSQTQKGWGVAQLVKCLPRMQVHTYKSSIQKVEAGGLEVNAILLMHSRPV